MTDLPRQPRHDHRRAGSSPAADGASPRPLPREGDNFILGADGQVLRDRYGRPIRRRSPGASPATPPRGDRSTPPPPAASPSYSRPQRRATSTPRSELGQLVRPQSRPPQSPPAELAARPEQYIPSRPPRRAEYQSARAESSRAEYQSRRQGFAQPTAQQYAAAQHNAAARHNIPQRAPAPGSAPPRRRRRRRRSAGEVISQTFSVLGVLLLALLVLLAGVVLWADTRLNRIDALPPSQVPVTAGTNWLLVGSDSRQGLTETQQAELSTGGLQDAGRTDTIMLLHIPRQGTASLISLPRDSYVEVPGYGMEKINAAFFYGGPQLLTQTVEQATGLHIDHYAEIGMGGLVNITDAVGGVELCPPEPMIDPLAGLDIAAGCQVLSGSQALGYVRTRATALGDLDRVARQREYFAALLSTVTSPSTLAHPVRLLSLINHSAGAFTVSTGDHVWHLARVALAMRSGVETVTVPVAGFQDTAVGNVVLWDEFGAAQLWESLR